MHIPEPRLETFRKELIAFAYHMLGNRAEAEDVVGETFAYFFSDPSKTYAVANPEAYVLVSVKNRCLNLLQDKKRQEYKGVYLPEPVFDETLKVENRVDTSYALTITLYKLNPKERAIFLLRECFDMEYKDLAQEFEFSEEHCRKLYQRAKEKITQDKASNKAAFNEALISVFHQALTTGDAQALYKHLKADLDLYSDGGGKAAAALKPLHGVDKVFKFLAGVYQIFQKEGKAFHIEPLLWQGQHYFVQYVDGAVDSFMYMELDQGMLANIYSVRNPEKLESLRSLVTKQKSGLSNP